LRSTLPAVPECITCPMEPSARTLQLPKRANANARKSRSGR